MFYPWNFSLLESSEFIQLKAIYFMISLEFIDSVLYDFPVSQYCCQNVTHKTERKTLRVALEATEQNRKLSTGGLNISF